MGGRDATPRQGPVGGPTRTQGYGGRPLGSTLGPGAVGIRVSCHSSQLSSGHVGNTGRHWGGRDGSGQEESGFKFRLVSSSRRCRREPPRSPSAVAAGLPRIGLAFWARAERRARPASPPPPSLIGHVASTERTGPAAGGGRGADRKSHATGCALAPPARLAVAHVMLHHSARTGSWQQLEAAFLRPQ